MAQWGQPQQGFQYPMQTGFVPQQQQPNQPQFGQQPQQFQGPPQQQSQFLGQGLQGGFGGGGILPQATGFPQQQQQQQQPQRQFIPPQQTGFGGMQPQQTGFGGFQQQRAPPPPPPVPPMPSQFQGQQTTMLQPQQPPSRFLSASPGLLLPQQTGFAGRGIQQQPLVAQPTGFVDPRLQMFSTSFLPVNPSAPYTPAGLPQLAPQNLVQSFQQHNQDMRGQDTQQMGWALSRAEKKKYDGIFRSWDSRGSGFIEGATALGLFGASGLPQNDLAQIWALSDVDNRGKLNIREFHTAMGLIYRRLNGNPIPSELPPELKPPSAEDSVELLKGLLDKERQVLPDNYSGRSNNTGRQPVGGRGGDASVYRHNDDAAPSGGVYQPRRRHVDRDAIRRTGDDSPSSDLNDIKRQLANTAHMLDRASEAEAMKTREDEELDQELEDLKYKVNRVQQDLDYNQRGPKSSAREEERRQLERELLRLTHEKIPEVERKVKAREERKEREKRDWVRARDDANGRFGRGAYEERPSSRGYGGRDSYRRSSRSRERSRDRYERERERDRDRERDRERDRDRDRSRDRYGDKEYDRPSSTRSPAPPTSPLRRPLEVPAPPRATPSPGPMKNMTPAERKAYAQAEAQRRIQQRMEKLGLGAPSSPSTPAPGDIDTSVEDRLAKEKREAEEKSKALESQREERERARKERVDGEKAIKEGRVTPAPPTPTSTVTAQAPAPTPTVKPRKAAPPPPGRPGRAAAAPPAPTPTATRAPPVTTRTPLPPPTRTPAFVPRPTPPQPQPAQEEEDPEEVAFRARQEALKKQKEEREAKAAARRKQLQEAEEAARAKAEADEVARAKEAKAAARRRQIEQEEAEEAARLKEEEEEERRFEEKMRAFNNRNAAKVEAAPAPPPAPPAATPATPTRAPPPSFTPQAATSPAEKSTNPFSRLIQQGSGETGKTNGSTNPWASASASSTPSVATATSAPPAFVPQPSKSPAPSSAGGANKPKQFFQTAPVDDDDDWDDIKEKDVDDGDSSTDEDEITKSRAARANIAQALFGNMMSRPTSAATPATPSSSTAPPAPLAPAPPAPPAPPAAPPAPRVAAPLAIPAAGGGTPNMGALMSSIQGGARLRPTKTVDKSAPPVSGRVLGDDTAPPAHIGRSVVSPPTPPPVVSAPPAFAIPEPMGHDDGEEDSFSERAKNRQSVDWMASRAVEGAIGGGVTAVDRLPSTLEREDEKSDDEEEYDMMSSAVPSINVGEHVEEAAVSDLMSDVDKGVEYRVRSLYAYEGEGADDLSFGENLILIANPSKSGGDWWFGKTVKGGKSGLFPKTYVDVVKPVKAKALYSYEPANADELPLEEGEVVDIVDKEEEEWWKAERDGHVLVVPAAYLELMEVGYDAPDLDGVGTGAIMMKTDYSHHQHTHDAPEERGIDSTEAMKSGRRGSIAGKREGSVRRQGREVEAKRQKAEGREQEGEEGEGEEAQSNSNADSDSDEDSDGNRSEYLSFEDDDEDDEDEDQLETTEEERMAREHERRMVLEAAGLLIVQRDAKEPAPQQTKGRMLVRARSKKHGRNNSRVEAQSLSLDTQMEELRRERDPVPGVGLEPGLPAEGGVTEAGIEGSTLAPRRPAPAAPTRRKSRRATSHNKDLPPIPMDDDSKPTTALDLATQLDDAYARYESFKNNIQQEQQQQQASDNRLSVVSMDSTVTSYSSPTSSFTLVSHAGGSGSRVDVSNPNLSSAATLKEPMDHSQSKRYSSFLGFLKVKTPEPPGNGGGGVGTGGAGDDHHPHHPHLLHPAKKLTISAPMVLGSHLGAGGNASTTDVMLGSPQSQTSGIAPGPPVLSLSQSNSGAPILTSTISLPMISAPLSSSFGTLQPGGESGSSPSTREPSPGFGTSWASLVDKTALEGFPVNERKRQEAIFELIHTEVAYVRDLQLIVEVFYSSLLEVLSQKEITVVFANVEDILLTNTAFLSSLEERQRDCRLYVDRIGDIILSHLPNMGVYMEYCVNQNTANKVLQSLKQNKATFIEHLNKLKENPAVRNLDLSSYLLEPMQRITRYPLLIKQIAHYTSASESVDTIEQRDMAQALDVSEKLLGSINETIRDQEGQEILEKLSAGGLWIGQGRLDLTAPTRCMGPRKLLKQGVVLKAKSGRKLRAYLCSDILVLTDENGKSLYRMPIPLAQAQVKELTGSLREGDFAFQVHQPYPRGGDAIGLKAVNAKEYKQWTREIGLAIRRCRHAEERAARKGQRI